MYPERKLWIMNIFFFYTFLYFWSFYKGYVLKKKKRYLKQEVLGFIIRYFGFPVPRLLIIWNHVLIFFEISCIIISKVVCWCLKAYLGVTVTIGLPAFCEIIFSCILKLLSDYWHLVYFILRREGRRRILVSNDQQWVIYPCFEQVKKIL